MNGDAGIGELLSVADAATLLRVSQSTIWRWIDQGRLPACRIGPKRVWIRKADIDDLVTDARPATDGSDRTQEIPAVERKLSDEERARGLAAIEEARKFRERLLAARGGRLLEPSWQLLHEMREERTRELS